MQPLEYSKWYTFSEAAAAVNVSITWIERYVGHAMKQGIIANRGTETHPKVSGADLKTVCMKRFSELENEYRWNAFEVARRRERGE